MDQAGADRGCQEQPKPNLAQEVQREQVGGSCLKYTQEIQLFRNYAGVLFIELFFSKRCKMGKILRKIFFKGETLIKLRVTNLYSYVSSPTALPGWWHSSDLKCGIR